MSELDGLWGDGGVGEVPGVDRSTRLFSGGYEVAAQIPMPAPAFTQRMIRTPNPRKMRAVKPPPPAPPVSRHMDPAVLARLEHEVLDTSPIQWAEEAASKVTA